MDDIKGSRINIKKNNYTIMKLTRVLRSLAKMVDTYSQFNPSPLSIKQFIDFGKNFFLLPL